jgi:hypothetical protein
MGSDGDGDIFQYPHVVVVPSLQPGCSCSGRQQHAKCRCHSSSTARSPGPRSPARSACYPNYLLKGGNRAVDRTLEERAARQEAAAWKVCADTPVAKSTAVVALSVHAVKQAEPVTLPRRTSKLPTML